MSRTKHALALGLVGVAALVPGVASAREDDDVLAGDADAVATVYAADGSTSTAAAPYGTSTFVSRLVAARAAGGSYVTDLVGDGQSAMTATPSDTAEYDAPAGRFRQLSRSGFARPTTARYRRLKVTTRRDALRKITARHFVNADGEQVEERGWAVDIATGAVRRVSLDAARTLSLDPRGGKAGTEYVYQLFIRP